MANSSKSVEAVQGECGFTGRTAVADASKIAEEELGVPITNTTMLGVLLKAVELVKMDSIKEPLDGRFGKQGVKNFGALSRAFNETTIKE